MKLILTFTAMLLIHLCAFAQTDPVRTELNSIFQNIDKTQIPTGYLNEYGPEVVYKKWINGVLSDSNLIVDMNTYNFLYNDIENCRINISGNTPPIYARVTQPIVPPLDSVKDWIEVARYDTVTNLALFSANYASLREDALQQNLFTKVGNQIFDVAGRTESPYIFNHTFAAVPVLTESKYTNEIRIGYTNLFYGNSSNTVDIVQVNFLDGAGYQNIYSNGAVSPITKTYTDSSGFKKFAVKVIYTNGSIDECYTGQMVSVDVPPAGNTANRYDILQAQEILNPSYSVIPISYLNVNPTVPILWSYYYPNAPFTQNLVRLQKFNQNMKVYVRYSKKRIGTALANKIVKPFIVVEGYDITDASQLLKLNNYNINSLLNEWNDLTAKYDFNKKLDDTAGYDLIFIDYYTMRDITENADYLLQAIDWINSQKVNNAVGVREQNIVMGISMGGLVSRYALAKRTKQTGTNSTETREYISMDSPHQGANVPLGLQHFLYDFGEVRIVRKIANVSDELKAFYYLNTLPSTQQQLILRVTDGNGGRANNTFLADGGPYRTMVDYNAPYPFYAISNGSQCAVPVMQPNTLLLKKEGNVANANWLLWFFNNKYRLNIQVNALPAYGTQAQICSVVMERNIRLFWGLIGTGWQTTSNTAPRISPANTIPWDGVPGGTKSTETAGPISQTGTTPNINIRDKTLLGNLWRAIVFPLFNVSTSIELPFSQKDFSFVPITSALDVQNVTANTFNQPFNFALNGLTGSRANKFIAQDFASSNLFNIEHTNYTPRNARWLYNEMENITQPITCNDQCIPSFTLDGPLSFCSNSATYSIPQLPTGATVIWDLLNTTPAFSSTWNVTANNTISLSSLQNGATTVKATISGPCIASPIILTKNITYAVNYSNSYGGSYRINGGSLQNLTPGSTFFIIAPRNGSVQVNLQATGSNNPTNILWYGNLNLTVPPYTFNTASQSIVANFITPCGLVSNVLTVSVMSNGGRNANIDTTLGFIANPNPVSDILNIQVNNPIKLASKLGEYQINICELNTLLPLQKLRILKAGGNIKINMSGFKTGYYAVEINDGENKQVLKIFKL